MGLDINFINFSDLGYWRETAHKGRHKSLLSLEMLVLCRYLGRIWKSIEIQFLVAFQC